MHTLGAARGDLRSKLAPMTEPNDDGRFDQQEAEADENHPAVLILTGVDHAPGTDESVCDEKHSREKRLDNSQAVHSFDHLSVLIFSHEHEHKV